MLERAYHKVNSRKAWVGESLFKKNLANIVNGSKQIPPLSDFPPTHSWKQFISEKPEKDSLKAVDVPQSLDLSLDSTHLPSWVWEVYCYHIISIVSKTLAFKIFVKFRSDLKLSTVSEIERSLELKIIWVSLEVGRWLSIVEAWFIIHLRRHHRSIFHAVIPVFFGNFECHWRAW